MDSTREEDREVLLARYRDLKFTDDVTGFQCNRCDRVLIRHYISNCGHKFCLNCKKLMDDGSRRWRCPLEECKKTIEHIHLQDVFFEETVFELRTHCPNHNYGCLFVGPLKDIAGHLRKCVDTRENALPVEIVHNKRVGIKVVMKEMSKLNEKMESISSTLNQMQKSIEKKELAQQRKWVEMDRKWTQNENKLAEVNGIDQNNKELKTKQSEMEKKWAEHDRKWTDVKEMVSSLDPSSKEEKKMREEHSSQLTALNVKLENLGKDLQNQILKPMSMVNERIETMSSTLIQMQKSMEEKEVTQERKWLEMDRKWDGSFKEVTSNVDKTSSQLNTLEVKVESLGEDLQNQVLKPMSKFNEQFETMSLSLSEMREEKLAQERKLEENNRKSEWNYKRTNQLEVELKQMMSQLSVEVSTLKENAYETEVSETSSSLKQEVYKQNTLKPNFQHFQRVSEYYAEPADFIWIINDIDSFLNGSEGELESEVFPLTGYPFGARAKITLDDKDVDFYLSFKHLNKSIWRKAKVVKPFPIIYFTLKDQSEGKDRKDLIRTSQLSFKDKIKFNRDYYIKGVAKSLLNSSLYIVEDKVEIAIHVEASEVAQSVYSEDGTLTWAIDDFRKRKQAETGGLIECQLSPYFYTGPKGLRVQVRAYLNGSDGYENKGLRIQVEFVNGAYDEDLEGSFAHKTTVTIFDPTQPTRSICKSKLNNSISSDLFEMGSFAEIESFLHIDTLYYKVEIIERK